MSIIPNPTIVTYGGSTAVSGVLLDGTVKVAGATVTLLGRPVLLIDWLALAETNTLSLGQYVFDAQTPTKNTTYGSLTKGQVQNPGEVNERVLKPVISKVMVKVKPKVTETLSRTSFSLGGSLYVTGKVVPAGTGGSVKWRFQRYVDGSWRTVVTTGTKLLVDDAGGTFSSAARKYTPTKRGKWRVRTYFVATTEYAGSYSIYKTFTVK